MLAFTVTDSLLHGEFSSYGTKWLSWTQQPNDEEHDYTTAPKGVQNPASVLLPTFGLCEVIELAKVTEATNIHRYHHLAEGVNILSDLSDSGQNLLLLVIFRN